MISLRVLPREEWEARLRALKCRPLEGKTKLNTAEWWVTEWSFLFTVPVADEYGYCDIWAFDELCEDIEASKKPGF